MKSLEQQARDLLERANVKDAQSMTSGDLVEIAELISLANTAKKSAANANQQASCTNAERKFLDAMWEHFRKNRMTDCPYCHYDGLGPGSSDLAKATVQVIDEGSVFSEEDAESFNKYRHDWI